MTKATYQRVFISVNMDFKNSTRLNGADIKLQRQTDNFDRKYTQPVNAIVIDAANIPRGAEILCHHNATHATYEIPDYKGLDGEYLSGTERYFSIPESECYAWRIGGEDWQPANGYAFGLRIFKPYAGGLVGLLPTQVKNKLYITTGDLKGKAVLTKAACDYTIIYQNEHGKEAQLIRLRHYNKPELREEIIAIDNETTDAIENGELLIGVYQTSAYQLNVLV